MPKRLRAWFGRPAPGSSRADVMRWVRRLNMGAGVMCVLFAAQLGLLGMELWWVLAAIGALNLLDALVRMPRRIRRIEAEPEPPRASPDVISRRRKRGMAMMSAVYVVSGAFGGFLAGGATGLAFGAILGAVGSLFGFRLARRWPQS